LLQTGTSTSPLYTQFSCEGAVKAPTNSASAPGAWTVENSPFWAKVKKAGKSGTIEKPEEVVKDEAQGGAIMSAKLVEMCKVVNAAYKANVGKQMAKIDLPACDLEDTELSTAMNTYGQCVDSRDKSISMVAPKSGYGNTVIYKQSSDTAYAATVSTAMCPLSYVHQADYEKADYRGLCGVNSTDEQPACPKGYSFNSDFTKIEPASKGLCTYNISTSDCPFGYTWNAASNKCRQTGVDDEDPKCTYNGKINYSTAGNENDGDGDRTAGLCVLYPTDLNCPKAHGVKLIKDGTVAVCQIPNTADEAQPKCLNGTVNGNKSEAVDNKGLVATYDRIARTCTIPIYTSKECASGPCSGLFEDADDTEKYLDYAVRAAPLATVGSDNAAAICKLVNKDYVPFSETTPYKIRDDEFFSTAKLKCTPAVARTALLPDCGDLGISSTTYPAFSETLEGVELITDASYTAQFTASDSKIYRRVCAVEDDGTGIFCPSNEKLASNFTSIPKILSCKDGTDAPSSANAFGNGCANSAHTVVDRSMSECVLESMDPDGCIEGDLNAVTQKCEIL
jgi:hypothetical protein